MAPWNVFPPLKPLRRVWVRDRPILQNWSITNWSRRKNCLEGISHVQESTLPHGREHWKGKLWLLLKSIRRPCHYQRRGRNHPRLLEKCRIPMGSKCVVLVLRHLLQKVPSHWDRSPNLLASSLHGRRKIPWLHRIFLYGRMGRDPKTSQETPILHNNLNRKVNW